MMNRLLFLAIGIIVVQGVFLFWFGQPWICECGYLKVWEGVVLSSGNSQHLSDWYTPSHVIHGVLFYLLFWALFPRSSVWFRLALVVGLETAWEVIENTPMVIDRYREQALAQGYIGDSIINSISDTLAMIGGFFLARVSPVWFSIAVVLILEIFVAYMIRDNLTLNVIQLIYPLEIVAEWQTGR